MVLRAAVKRREREIVTNVSRWKSLPKLMRHVALRMTQEGGERERDR